MILQELKALDYDKYLAVGYAPEDLKQPLAAIFLYGLEIEKIPLEVSEAMVGHVKIQWWREVLAEVAEGKPCRPHPILLALKGHNIDYSALAGILEHYDAVVEDKLPQDFAALKSFLLATDVVLLSQAANLLKADFDENTALSYVFNRYARKLRGKNDALSNKLFAESALLNPNKTKVFGAITAFYNRHNSAPKWRLALSLLAGNHKLL